MRHEPAQQRIQIWIDSLGMPLSGSVDWLDRYGSPVETLVTQAGPFESVPEFAQVLADQKPRTHLDKQAILHLDVG